MVFGSLYLHVSKEEDTIRLGEVIGSLLEPGSIIALKGQLGAGKTVLVKGIARGLKVEEEPNSPTFVIMNAYEGRIPLYHFDLYRISGIDELEGIGYEDYFFGDGVSVIEWADLVKEILPEETIKIEIKIPEEKNSNSENERYIKIEGNEKWLSLFRSTVERVLPTQIK
ncbi:MAG: tRNA (adenosine(37)-N6)-threonylcarbamoyltransferase complex ATPase subunit type 1 TsaE [Deltaproteobacteria bacterium]|nr:tRNA (adenosine(37)-N6)-threonylcarbamoyltransferase complex ATPase subunit type 1 TsaE [Deltaproteobacteria bacterium]